MESTSTNIANNQDIADASLYWLRKTRIRECLGLEFPHERSNEEMLDIIGCNKNQLNLIIFRAKDRIIERK